MRTYPQGLRVPLVITVLLGLFAAGSAATLPLFASAQGGGVGSGSGGPTAGGVSGHLLLPDGTASAAASAVVWLEAPGLHGVPLRRAVIDQREKRFIPHLLVVTPGTKVQFPNSDTVFHNVFAYFEAKRFDLGMYPRGTTKAQTFDKPGVVSVLCNVHPQMSAFIVVVDSPYRALTDKNGDFRFDGVPSGTYTVRAWQESGAIGTTKVTVASGGETVPFTLKLERH